MRTFPGYRLGKRLHIGRRTVIHRAVRISDGKPVIIKSLIDTTWGARDGARLRHEFSVLNRLHDDGIIRVVDFVGEGVRAALILEDIDGVSLRERMLPGGLPAPLFLDLAIKITAAVAATHAAGIVHRDIKPDNIIVNTTFSRVVLSDFGIASVLAQECVQTPPPEILEGSLAYISPEQTGRMNRPVDYRSDFYSLGVTFYELLAGRVPFRSNDPVELIHAHIARVPTPPANLNPEIPAIVSDIVVRLMAKNAEARYQSTAGILADLERVSHALAQGQVTSFKLGQDDRSVHFRVPARLYGREDEVAQLLNAFERVCVGNSELVLIAGSSGIGKSALVCEVHRPVVEHRGYFVAGKFDQLGRATPYSALAKGLRDLIRQILGESPTRLARWRERLSRALEPNGAVLLDVVPELVNLLGPQTPVPDVAPTESANRFHATLRSLLHTLSDEQHPLVIFLDDLQWSDIATLKLIEELAGDPELCHLLWIGAYRDDETPADHPLQQAIRGLETTSATVQQLRLPPLSPAHVAQILADTLSRSSAEVQGLADLLHRRSEGNPFFVRTYLSSLYEQGVFVYNHTRGEWTWTMGQIEAAAIPEGVVDLVLRGVTALPRETQELLETAACIGSRFDIHLLAQMTEQSPAQILTQLWAAVEGGLIRPVGDRYKYLGDTQPGIEFDFVHDRVQQAVYSLVPDAARSRTHLAAGRGILALAPASLPENTLFAVAEHLRVAEVIVSEPQERTRFAHLELRAARHAKQATAYHSACKYLQAGFAYLPTNAWSTNSRLIADLHRERVECEYLAGNPESAINFFTPLLARTKTRVEKAYLYALLATLETNRGRLSVALAAGRDGFALFGFILPEKGSALTVMGNLARFQVLKRGHTFESLRALPQLQDEEVRAQMEISVASSAAAYFTDTNLTVHLLLRIANLSLQHGACEISGYGFIGVGLVLAGMHQYESAYEYGRLADSLNERFGDVKHRTKVSLFWATFMMVWVRPFQDVQKKLSDTSRIGLETGDIIYSVYCAVTEALLMMVVGDSVEALKSHCDALLLLVRRRGLRDQIETLSYMIEVFGAWLGTQEKVPDCEDSAFVARISDAHTPVAMFYHYFHRGMVLYILGDFVGAHAALESARPRMKVAFGSVFILDFYFYDCLTILRIDAKPKLQRAAVKRCLKMLQGCVRTAPMNFSSREALVSAEWARVRGQDAQAMREYNRAIECAEEQRSPNIRAIACECAARFALDRGYSVMARSYILGAVAAYREWGAVGRATALMREHNLYSPEVRGDSVLQTYSASVTTANLTLALDLSSVLKAGQAISGELDMSRLLRRLALLLVENAGASRALLLLMHEDGLRVEAEATGDGEVEVGMGTPIDHYQGAPLSILRHVERLHEDILLVDAIADPVHAGDPYIVEARPRALLCTPLLYQGELSCVLYLENTLTVGVFTLRRLAVMKQLAAQVAISLENARLYKSLDDERRNLEAKVELRTQELRAAKDAAETASRAKSSFLASMSHELRTPLNAILGFTQILLSRTGWPPQDHEHLQIIGSSGTHLLGLINSVLEMSKIEAGKLSLSPTDTDLRLFIHSFVGMFQPRAQAKGLRLEVMMASELPEMVEVDLGKLRLVLINLVSNAVKFCDAGHVAIRVTEGEPTRTDQVLLKFEVEDSGPGIDTSEQHLVFEAFGQTASGRGSHEGTGLGLAIARQLVHLMGGELAFTSTSGVGTTFFFTIKVGLGTVVKRVHERLPLPKSDARLAGFRILIVEDKVANRQVLIDLLSPYGFGLKEAENGQEGVEMWTQWHPQLVLMDMRMPVMDGYEATSEIRRRDEQGTTSIVALTASAFEEQRAEIFECGCEALVLKPFRHREIFSVIERFLGVRLGEVEERDTPCGDSGRARVDVHSLVQELPTMLRTRVHEAATRADEELLRELLRDCPELGPLADLLTESINDYRFDEIVGWTQPVAG